MTAIPIKVGTPQKFHIKVMVGTTEIVAPGPISFTSTDPTKASVAATGSQDCTVTPIAGNADGSSALCTILAHLPASANYAAGDGAQDVQVTVIQIPILVFVPV